MDMSKIPTPDLLTLIFDTYPAQTGNGMGKVTGYAIALDGIGDKAQRHVFVRLLRGLQKGFDGKFCPTPAQLATWCREEQHKLDRQERERNEPQLVAYPIGGEPPKGYVALSEYDERREQKERELHALTHGNGGEAA